MLFVLESGGSRRSGGGGNPGDGGPNYCFGNLISKTALKSKKDQWGRVHVANTPLWICQRE